MANDQRPQQQRPQNTNPSPAQTTTVVNTPSNPMPNVPTRKGWEEQVQEYLWEKGWKPSGYAPDEQVLWDDPMGSNDPPEKKYSHSLKDESGNEIKVMQTFAKPIPWAYKTAEAYSIQRARDQWDADAPKRQAEATKKEEARAAWQRELAARRARRMGVQV